MISYETGSLTKVNNIIRYYVNINNIVFIVIIETQCELNVIFVYLWSI